MAVATGVLEALGYINADKVVQLKGTDTHICPVSFRLPPCLSLLRVLFRRPRGVRREHVRGAATGGDRVRERARPPHARRDRRPALRPRLSGRHRVTIPASALSLIVFLVSRVIGRARGDQCECCRGVRWLQEKNQDEPSVSSSPALHEACKKVKDMARFLGHVMVSERATDASHELNTATAAHWRNHEPAPCR